MDFGNAPRTAPIAVSALATAIAAAGSGIGLRGALVAEIGYLAGLATPVFPSTFIPVRRECFRHDRNAFISPCAIP